METSAISTAEQHRRWQALMDAAHAAGIEAGETCQPRPMIVTASNSRGEIVREYYVEEGVCGFAYVNLYPKPGGESRRFINWATGRTKSRHGCPFAIRKSYQGGYSLFVIDFGQSMARKERYAHAFAEILREAGIDGLQVFSSSRMD